MLCYDWLHRHDINATEIGVHVGILATLSYQITKQIQQEKKDNLNISPSNTDIKKDDVVADNNTSA